MSISPRNTSGKLAAALRRRSQRVSMASVDINADYQGRRVSGDPRLDFVTAEHPVRF